MPRYIDKLVVHHSVTQQFQNGQEAIDLIDHEHNPKLHDEINSFGYYIAYHNIIDASGKIWRTRHWDDIGHHAGNWEVNTESISVCLLGNFEFDKPTDEQMSSLKQVINEAELLYDGIEVVPHRDVRATLCPGENLFNLLTDINMPEEKRQPQLQNNITLDDWFEFIALLTPKSDAYNSCPWSSQGFSNTAGYYFKYGRPKDVKMSYIFEDTCRDYINKHNKLGISPDGWYSIPRFADVLEEATEPLHIDEGFVDYTVKPGNLYRTEVTLDNFRRKFKQGRAIILQMNSQSHDYKTHTWNKREIPQSMSAKHIAPAFWIDGDYALVYDRDTTTSSPGYPPHVKRIHVNFLMDVYPSMVEQGINGAYLSNPDYFPNQS